MTTAEDARRRLGLELGLPRTIRPTMPARAALVSFDAVLIVESLVLAVTRDTTSAWIAPTIVTLALAHAACVLSRCASVTFEGLDVRNWVVRRHIDWTDIAWFEVRLSWRARDRSLVEIARATGKAVPILASSRKERLGKSEEANALCDELRAIATTLVAPSEAPTMPPGYDETYFRRRRRQTTVVAVVFAGALTASVVALSAHVLLG